VLIESHLKWIKDIERQNVTLQYPIIADENKSCWLYDMIHPMQMILLQYVLFCIGADKSEINFNISLWEEILMSYFA
jgi:alkyl hydroperoxide reductase subunit AhpC